MDAPKVTFGVAGIDFWRRWRENITHIVQAVVNAICNWPARLRCGSGSVALAGDELEGDGNVHGFAGNFRRHGWEGCGAVECRDGGFVENL
jgi:hypothetical protein